MAGQAAASPATESQAGVSSVGESSVVGVVAVTIVSDSSGVTTTSPQTAVFPITDKDTGSVDGGIFTNAAEPTPTECLPPPINLTAICHRPPGNPEKSHTIFVSSLAVKAHMAHGDLMGLCANENVSPHQATKSVTTGKISLQFLGGEKTLGLKVEIRHGVSQDLTTLSKKLPPGIHQDPRGETAGQWISDRAIRRFYCS